MLYYFICIPLQIFYDYSLWKLGQKNSAAIVGNSGTFDDCDGWPIKRVNKFAWNLGILLLS